MVGEKDFREMERSGLVRVPKTPSAADVFANCIQGLLCYGYEVPTELVGMYNEARIHE